MSSAFAQTADINYIAENQVTATATATQTATVNYQAEGQTAISSEFTQTTSALTLILAQASMSARTSLFASRYVGSARPRNLTDTGATFVTSPVKFGTYSFEGSLQLPYAGNLAKDTIPSITDDFALEFWFYRDGTTATTLFRWETLTPNFNPAFILVRYNATGTLTLQLGSDTISVINSTAVTNANWHHVLISKNSSNISLFVNGTRSGTRDITAFTSWDGRGATQQRLTITAGTHFIDEASLHIGTTLGYNPGSSTITVPTTARVNDADTTAFLYHFENNGLDDVALAQTGAAALTATATQSTQARKNVSAQSALSANATISVDGSIGIEGEAELTSTATLSAVVGLLQEQTATLSSNTTLTATAIKINGGDSAFTSDTALTADNVRLRRFVIAVDSLFTPSLSVDVFKNQVALLEVTATLTADITTFSDSNADLSSSFAMVTGNERILQFSSAVTAQSTLSAVVGFERSAESSLTATTTQTAANVRVRYAASSLTAAATQTATAFRTQRFTATISSAMNFVLQENYFEGTQVALTATASLTASYRVTESSWNQRTWWRGAYNSNYTTYGPKAIGSDADDYSWELYGWESNLDTTHGFMILERRVKTGDIEYQKWFTFGFDVEGELSGSVYKDGFFYVSYSAFTTLWRTAVLKIRATDGEVIWQNNASGVEKIEDIAVDDSGNVYLAGWNFVNPIRYSYGKLNSSGVRQWNRNFGFASGSTIQLRATKISVAEGFLWVNIDRDNDTGANDSYLIKARLDTGDHIDGIDINLGRVKSYAGSLYAIEDNTTSGGNTLYKFDTNLNIQAKKQIGTWNIADFDIDEGGNLYFVSEDFSIARVNSDWSTPWVSRFASQATSGSAGSLRPLASRIIYDGDQKVYVSGMNDDVFLNNSRLSLTLFGRINRDFGINYYTSPIPYKDNIQVFNGATSGDDSSTGYWTYAPDSLTITDLTPGTFTVFLLQAQNTSPHSGGGVVEILGYTTPVWTNYEYLTPVSAIGYWDSTASLSAQISRTRTAGSTQTAVSTLVGAGTLLIRAEATLTAQVSASITAVKTARITRALTATATQTADIRRLRSSAVSLSAQATISASASKFTGVASTQIATATQTTAAERFRSSVVSLQAISSKLTAAVTNATGTVLLESQATLSCLAIKTADLPSFLTATTAVSAEVRKVVRVDSQMSAQTSIQVTVEKIIVGSSSMSVTATHSAQVRRIAGLSTALSSSTQISAQAQRNRRAIIVYQSQFALSAAGQRIRPFEAQVNSRFTGLFVFGKITRITANLSALNFQITVGDVINLDPALTYIVPQEHRTLIVKPESREYLIEPETRIYKLIKG
jgi:hypothetical protein